MDPYGYGLSPVDFSQLVALEYLMLKDLDHAAFESPPVAPSAVQSNSPNLTLGTRATIFGKDTRGS